MLTRDEGGRGQIAPQALESEALALRSRRATSSALARLLNAETRKKPSPLEPKPLPGVMTTFNSRSIQSKVCQLV